MMRVHISRQSTTRALHRDDLLLNVKKTNEVIVDFRKKEAKTHTAVHMSGAGPSS